MVLGVRDFLYTVDLVLDTSAATAVHPAPIMAICVFELCGHLAFIIKPLKIKELQNSSRIFVSRSEPWIERCTFSKEL